MPSLCGSSSSTSSYYPLAISGIGEKALLKTELLLLLRNHKEAERRRRERISSHLNKLRNVLSCNYKTDKATLLAKVVQRVKELKQQTLEISDATKLFYPQRPTRLAFYTMETIQMKAI
ncbi:Transcription factor bHLH106 [Raphanus sativus]|nr:Transcription factor bHLH106 [Raphanus sativus]